MTHVDPTISKELILKTEELRPYVDLLKVLFQDVLSPDLIQIVQEMSQVEY